jgi:predicted HicB family RNase H-like nuclease
MKPDDPEMKVANIVPFGLRLQPELKRRVEEAAKANNRSLNAEISARLERSF